MIGIQEVYNGSVPLWPQLVAPSTTPTTNVLDITAAANSVAGKIRILLYYGASDTALTVAKLQGSNTNNGSDWADISGSIIGTDVDVNGTATTLPGTTSDNHVYGWLVNTNGGAYRYYKVVITTSSAGSAGAQLAVIAELDSRSNILSPIDYAQGLTICMAVPLITPASH